MMIEPYNFRLAKGETWVVDFLYGTIVEPSVDGALLIPGDVWGRYYVPIDVSGYSAVLKVRNSATFNLIDTLSDSNTKVTVAGSLGKFTARAQTSEWDFDKGDLKWAMTITDSNDAVVELRRGLLTLAEQIS